MRESADHEQVDALETCWRIIDAHDTCVTGGSETLRNGVRNALSVAPVRLDDERGGHVSTLRAAPGP